MLIDIDEVDLPGMDIRNIIPAQKIAIVHGKVPDRKPRKRLGESFDLIRIKGQIRNLHKTV